jgi:hypothetical protein
MSNLLTLAVALAVTILLVLAGAPVPAAAALLLLAAVITLVPIADRPLLHWFGPALGYCIGGGLGHVLGSGRSTWSAADGPLPVGTAVAWGQSPRRSPRRGLRRAPLPPECGRLMAMDQAPSEGPMGAAPVAVLFHTAAPRPRSKAAGPHEDLPRGARTVVLELCSTGGFGLLEPPEQDTTLAGWGGSLDALAADARVLRVQWLTHTRPAPFTHLSSDLGGKPRTPTTAGARNDVDFDVDSVGAGELHDDYADLVTAVTAQAWTHTHLLAVTLRPDTTAASRPGRRGRDHGISSQHDEQLSLLEQVREITGRLLSAELLARPLSLAELGGTLRLLTEPDYPGLSSDPSSVLASDLGSVLASDLGAAEQAWGVRCRRTDWTTVRTGDAWHRSYAVSDWPNLALSADWLTGILASTPTDGTTRTLSMHARPVSPVHAVRQARAAAAKVHLDAADRSRFGLTATPGAAAPLDDQRASDAAALETELAAGYRMLHTRAVITISAIHPHRLQQATAALRATAATHRLDLRPLHGQHHLGLVATLPLTVVPGSRP